MASRSSKSRYDLAEDAERFASTCSVGNCSATSARVDARLSAARWAAGSAPWATEPSVFFASVRASSGVMVPALASVRRLVGALRPLAGAIFYDIGHCARRLNAHAIEAVNQPFS